MFSLPSTTNLKLIWLWKLLLVNHILSLKCVHKIGCIFQGSFQAGGRVMDSECFTTCFCHVGYQYISGVGGPYRRKFLSPTATLMSSSSSIVAFTAKSAALWWSEPWLDPALSLLMPPTGSSLLVRSTNPPWLHLPCFQRENVCISYSSFCSWMTNIGSQRNVDGALKVTCRFYWGQDAEVARGKKSLLQ